MVVLDTSALVRFFTRDDDEKASKVRHLLKTEKKVIIPDVVLPELEYVLRGIYKTKGGDLIKLYDFLLDQKNIRLSGVARKAIGIFRRNRLDMADCLIVASSLTGRLASFDKKMLRPVGLKVKKYWKR